MPWSKLSVLPHRLSAGKKGERGRGKERRRIRTRGVRQPGSHHLVIGTSSEGRGGDE